LHFRNGDAVTALRSGLRP